MNGEEAFDRFVGRGVSVYEVVANYGHDIDRLARDIADIRFYEPDGDETPNWQIAEVLLEFCREQVEGEL